MQENSKEYVMYESFDELPDELKEKFKSGASGSNLSKARDGYVDFINQSKQRGDELIGDYVGVMSKTQVKFGDCGHVANISPAAYKKGVNCGVCGGRQVQKGVNDLSTISPSLAKEWHPTKNGELTPYDVTQNSNKKVWWQCEKGHEWEATTNNRAAGNGCPYCSNKKVLKGYNDIATTHPQYVKYFANIEDAYTHTYSSDKRVKMKCPDCGYTKSMRVSKLTQQGFSCDLCSDGISYPEKLMVSVLNKLNIDFIKQMSYDDGEHKYDFYLPKYNAILETHGLQHYMQSGRGRSLEEEQENDRYKRELAISKGILNENYHEIDCRHSTLDYCRRSIEEVMNRYADLSALTNNDWKQLDIKAQKSLKTEVCKYWKENKEVNGELTTQQVADVFGVAGVTIRRYLKWGNTNGFCVYDMQSEIEGNHRRNSNYVYLINSNGDKWFEESMSVKELSKTTGISRGAICGNLNKGTLKPHKNSKYDPKYIGSRIVSAEVYDSQIQSNQNA